MFNRKYIFNPGPFSVAMLVYWRIPSLKLTLFAPEIGWLEGFLSGVMLIVSGSVDFIHSVLGVSHQVL